MAPLRYLSLCLLLAVGTLSPSALGFQMSFSSLTPRTRLRSLSPSAPKFLGPPLSPKSRLGSSSSRPLKLKAQQQGPSESRLGDLDIEDSDTFFTGEMYPSGDGTKIMERADGTTVLERIDGTEVLKADSTGIYSVDVESVRNPGTESNANTFVTTVKVIVGGVAPLLMPFCIKSQGLIEGPITVLVVGLLSAHTVRQLVEYKDAMAVETGRDNLTYVDVATHAFGALGGWAVFSMTVLAGMGICAAYSAFIGNTMASLAATDGTLVNWAFGSEVTSNQFQLGAALLVLPANILGGNPRFISFAAYLGASAVAAGVLTTCVYGFTNIPNLWLNFLNLPLFGPPSTFFQAFGIIPFLFCVHWAVLPIERSMKQRGDFSLVIDRATWVCILSNSLFGVLGFTFFGSETSSVILNNLSSGPLLDGIRMCLVLDMLVSFPVMLSSSRELVENALLGPRVPREPAPAGSSAAGTTVGPDASEAFDLKDLVTRNAIRACLLGAAFGIAQLNDVGKICNLVGGVAQGVMAFIIPPALAIRGSQRWGSPSSAAGADDLQSSPPDDSAQQQYKWKTTMSNIFSVMIIIFGGVCVTATGAESLLH